MRICIYSHYFWPSIGGIETVSELLAAHLHRAGVQVTVVTQTPHTQCDTHPYRVVRRPTLLQLRQVMAACDVVHCNGMSVRGLLSAWSCGVAAIITHHTFNSALPRSFGELHAMVMREGLSRPPHAAASSLLMRRAETNVCTSRFICERLRPPRAVVIYSPISRIFRPLPDAQRTDRFAFVGRLVPDKGCHILLRALANCTHRNYQFGLDVYGDGPERHSLELLARESLPPGAVTFHGSATCEALVQAYNRSLAVVVPSVWDEPLGLVALEAMACGRAVIAADVGGLPETVGGRGLLFPRGNAGALADCLIRAAEDSGSRRQREADGELFGRSFTIDVIGEQYVQLFRKALETRANGDSRANRPRAACYPDPSANKSTLAPPAPQLRNGRPGVLVAHPGTQHSYQTARVLQEHQLLMSFLTGFYYKLDGSLARTLQLLPSTLRQRMERELLRRYMPGLSSANVQTHPAAELIYLAAARIPVLRGLSESLLHRRNERFDLWVAQTLTRQRPSAVICFDTCAARAFETAQALGIRCVLDQSVGHVRAWAEVYRHESELHPDFADSLPGRIPQELIDRCTQEALSADLILVASEYVRQTLLSVGVAPARIRSVPYGVDTDRFRPSAPRQDNTFRALFVGQISQRKGIKYLLEAWKGLRLPNAELLLAGTLIGSGRGLSAYSGCFRRLPPLPHSEVHRVFAEADVFVYPSLHEGSALAIHEALACGLPVITTPNSGSVIRDGREGFVVPIRDVEALQEKILLLYSNPELRQQMSLHARSRAEEFTWAAYRCRLVAAILDLLTAESGEQSP